ncbi:phage Gp37/Gp68 family protein [Stappia sp. WLB 29]|uniref:DUF5131 family protein n=1 Tax=Stappia sp. WLB 29 TaxID=2925220 RepID=UPI0020C00C79|nr:phage Gp37/Gp68 family protein [Stappia sp. WLB 29]
MADRTSISWTDATWNPLAGCSRVSEGCRNCYAEAMAARFNKPGQWGEGLATMVRTPDGRSAPRWTGEVRFNEGALGQPLRWRKPRRIFVNSTSDLFHEAVPDEWIDKVFAVMALSPQHTFQILTKRPERMREYMQGVQSNIPNLGRMPLERIHLAAAAHMEGDGGVMDMLKERGNVYSLYLDAPWPLHNVWLGVSVEDQVTADVRIPYLLATPAAVRFISAEPLLGPVDLASSIDLPGGYEEVFPLGIPPERRDELEGPKPPRLDWVIVGGESGPRARPMHPDWVRKIRDQCTDAAVPFHFKQWGCHLPAGQTATQSGLWNPSCGSTLFTTVKNAGRRLDGVEHMAFPGVTP